MKTPKKLLAIFLTIFVFTFLNTIELNSVNASVYSGIGNNATGGATTCASFRVAYYQTCGVNGSGGGGASWHIYKTNGTVKPIYNPGVLVGGINANTIESSICGSHPWYMVYGWDGPNNSVVYGPLGHAVKIGKSNIAYNKYNAIDDIDVLKTLINNQTFTEGQKVSQSVADALYQQSNGSNWPLSSLPAQTGYFCVPESAIPNNTYYSQSNAGGANGYVQSNLDPTNGGVTVNAPDVTIEVGGSTPIAFSHNIYAKYKIENTDVNWQVHRKFYYNGVYHGEEGFDVESIYDFKIEGANNGEFLGVVHNINQSVSGLGLARFIASSDDRPYQNEGYQYVARDSYRKVTFNKEGTYKFCETLDVRSFNTPSTTACIKINVIKKSYYSKSNISNEIVSNGEKVWEGTDFSNIPVTANSDDISIDVNDTVNITFSHNLYSESKQDDQTTKYYIQRSVNSIAGITSSDYTIDSTSPPAGNSSGGTGAKVEGTASFTTKKSGDPYYIGGPRNYTDGNSEYDYILRDFYKITFKQEGVYKFCETVYIYSEEAGQYLEYTSACSRIQVGDVEITDGDCADISWFNQKSGETSVASAVKNTSVPSYNSWSKEVYAKPNDNIQWLHCYYAGVQSKAETEVTENHVHSSHPNSLSRGTYENDNTTISNLLGRKWQNQYTITTKKDTATTKFPTSQMKTSTKTFFLDIGRVSTEQFNDQYTIKYRRAGTSKSDTGKELIETIKTGTPSSISFTTNESSSFSWSCNPHDEEYDCGTEEEPKTCTRTVYDDGACKHGNEYITCSGQNSTDDDSASVIVPYNFNIGDVKVNLGENYKDEENQKSVFAGETISITNMSVDITPKSNSVTSGTYATRADDVKLHLIGYISDSNADKSSTHSGNSGGCSAISSYLDDYCDVIAEDTTSLNGSPESLYGKTENHLGGNYNVFDVKAGYYYCIVAAVYPSSSGKDTQTSTSGNGKWAVSAPSCVKVAKRPSLQIWGASLYSTGNLVADPAIKRVIAGVYEFEDSINDGMANSKANQTVFGSWVEYSITSTGENGGYTSYGDIASGASTGAPGDEHYRTGTFDRSPNESLGGSHEGANVSLCDYRSPLTIPNEPCGGPGNLTPGGETSSATPTDKSSLLSNFTDKENGTYTYLDNYSKISDFIKYGLGENPVIELGKTYVLESKVGNDLSNFTIDSNITYENTTYSITSEIPKLIIHAENININCNVENIHAVLIAEETVDTCSDIDTINSAEASKPLKIFGTVISDKLVANRTYGSATGINTSVPAEIIDYDTSLYLWGSPRANTDTSGKTTVTYQTELAPRL